MRANIMRSTRMLLYFRMPFSSSDREFVYVFINLSIVDLNILWGCLIYDSTISRPLIRKYIIEFILVYSNLTFLPYPKSPNLLKINKEIAKTSFRYL